MADLEFQVAKRRHEPITFTLGDDYEYTFHAPKSAVMLMPLFDSEGGSDLDITRSTFDWLGQGLSEEDSDKIKDRLRDAEDDLDIDLLAEVVQKLSEKVSSGRPTT